MGIAPVVGAVVGIAGVASQAAGQQQQAQAQQQQLAAQEKQKQLEMDLANQMYGYQTQSVAYQSALKQQVADISTAAAIQTAELTRQGLVLDNINTQTNLNTSLGNSQIKESAANQQAYQQEAATGYQVAGAEQAANQAALQVIGNNVSARAGQAAGTLANQANTQTGVRSQVATQEGLVSGAAKTQADVEHALELGRVQQTAASGIAASNTGFESSVAYGVNTQTQRTNNINSGLILAGEDQAKTQNTINDLGYQLDALGQQNFLDTQKQLGDSTAMAQIAAMQYQSQAIASAQQQNSMAGLLQIAQIGVNTASSMNQPQATTPNYYGSSPGMPANDLGYYSGSLYSPTPYSPSSQPSYGSYSSGTVMQPISMSGSTGLFSGGSNSGLSGSVGGTVGAGIMG